MIGAYWLAEVKLKITWLLQSAAQQETANEHDIQNTCKPVINTMEPTLFNTQF